MSFLYVAIMTSSLLARVGESWDVEHLLCALVVAGFLQNCWPPDGHVGYVLTYFLTDIVHVFVAPRLQLLSHGVD